MQAIPYDRTAPGTLDHGLAGSDVRLGQFNSILLQLVIGPVLDGNRQSERPADVQGLDEPSRHKEDPAFEVIAQGTLNDDLSGKDNDKTAFLHPVLAQIDNPAGRTGFT